MTEQRQSASTPWRLTVLAGMASYLDAAALITTGAALVMYKNRLEISAGDIGLLSGLLTLMFAAGALTGGRLGDVFGRRLVFTSSLGLYLAGALVLAAAQNDAMLILGIVALGFAIGADLPVSLALIDEEAPEEQRGKMVSFTAVLWAAGIVAASLTTIIVGHLDATGARIAYLHLAVVAAVVLALRARTGESSQWQMAKDASDAAHGTQTGHEAIDFSSIPDLLRGRVGAVVLATGLYITLWTLSANTLGAFGSFMWVELADQEIETQFIWGAIALPLAVVGLVIFLKVVDTTRRSRWFAIGSAMSVLAWLFPLALGPTALALILLTITFQVSASFSGEVIYKVWSQERLPVLLRSTGQGLTLCIARTIAAAAAIGTPTLALAYPRLLFVLLIVCSAAAAMIGLCWIPRLAKAETIRPGKCSDSGVPLLPSLRTIGSRPMRLGSNR